jgi:hypothetical protein
MKTSTSMNCLRLAAMIAVTLMPGKAACTYSASANAPTLSANGGYVSVTVATQPGCRWSVNRPDSWVTPLQTYATGSGTVYLYIASARAARSAVERVYPDYLSGEYTLNPGTIGGRSSVTGQVMLPFLQFRISQN